MRFIIAKAIGSDHLLIIAPNRRDAIEIDISNVDLSHDDLREIGTDHPLQDGDGMEVWYEA